ncbi:hypothetical protein GCM10022237_41940 [Nocardioides ginsengisoli]|uniref:ParB/Sulfiredoxin domain-containing protein n=1 Tax=Nocardioides ginsengisoli TaxID=363868 RepID=A0ABW3W594_9ACTN
MTDLHATRGRHAVLSAPTRHRLARVTRWHPGTREVRLSRLLLGGQNGMTGQQFATAMADPLWPSRRVVEGPHAELLRRGPRQTDEQILRSSYGRMARTTVRVTGRYFGATDDAGVVVQARQFLARASGGLSSVPTGDLHSPPGQPVLVVPIADSDCYQVLDGHHRIALAAAAGESGMPVRVRRGHVTTPLQDLLGKMSWINGNRELYQPVDSPELEALWPIVRCCVDRLEAMEGFLRSRGLLHGSYLDVASCYGWFVGQMETLGMKAEGIERDPLGATLGRLMYAVDPHSIRIGDVVDVLRGTTEQWDVVSCFSLLHHFVLGRGACDEIELAKLLDKATRRVLFFDTGQEHERWFQKSLRGWNPEHIREFLLTHTTFDEILDLGPDRDAVGPYAENYGRHLFVCVRASDPELD